MRLWISIRRHCPLFPHPHLRVHPPPGPAGPPAATDTRGGKCGRPGSCGRGLAAKGRQQGCGGQRTELRRLHSTATVAAVKPTWPLTAAPPLPCAALYCRLFHTTVPPSAARTAITSTRSHPVWRRGLAMRILTAILLLPCCAQRQGNSRVPVPQSIRGSLTSQQCMHPSFAAVHAMARCNSVAGRASRWRDGVRTCV